MTNTEYEAACITAAGCYDRFEGEHKLRQIDEIIKNLETSLANLHGQRREIVNQYNLNQYNLNQYNLNQYNLNQYNLNKPKDCRNNLNGCDSHFCPECTK